MSISKRFPVSSRRREKESGSRPDRWLPLFVCCVTLLLFCTQQAFAQLTTGGTANAALTCVDCDTTACAGAGQIRVEPLGGGQGALYICNPTTGLYEPLPAGGGGGAPISAEFIVNNLNATLTGERDWTDGDGILSIDGGANGTFTVRLQFKSGIASPTATDCDIAGESDRVYRDTDDGVDGRLYICSGAGGWIDFSRALKFTNLTVEGNLTVKGPNPWVDVKAPPFNAVCDGTTNDTTAIQAAIDFAGGAGGGAEVRFPNGKCRATQINWKQRVTLRGSGYALFGNPQGTVLEQIPATNLDFIVSDSALLGTDYFHGASIVDMTISGTPTDTTGSGIKFNSRIGEGTKLEHITVRGGFPQHCIAVTRGGTPTYWEDLHLFGCGLYGIDYARTGTDINQTIQLNFISGDNHGSGLIHLNTTGGTAIPESFALIGIKCEKSVAGRNNDCIVLDNLNGSPVLVANATFRNTSAEAANAVIRIATSSVRLSWVDLAKESDVTSIIDDAVNVRTFNEHSGALGGNTVTLAVAGIAIGSATSAADVVLSRGAANRLDLAIGDSLNLVDGIITLAGAGDTVDGRNLDNVVDLAGQLGGTVSSPDVRGLRETGTPTLLTMGAVADLQCLSRSGTTIAGVACGGGASEWTDEGANLRPADAADDWVRVSGDTNAPAIGSTTGTSIGVDIGGGTATPVADFTWSIAADIITTDRASATEVIYDFTNSGAGESKLRAGSFSANGTAAGIVELCEADPGIECVIHDVGALASNLTYRWPVATSGYHKWTVAAGVATATFNAVIPVADGGTNLTAAADDNVMVGNATTWESKAIPNCNTESMLTYTTATNTWGCETDTAGAGSGDAIRVEDGDNLNTFTAATDPDFIDDGDINFILDAAATPDTISTAVRAGAITDAKVNASGITTRSKLPAAIAYEDEANVFVHASGQEIEQSAANPIALRLQNLQGAAAGSRLIFDTADANTDIELQPTATGGLEIKDSTGNPQFRFLANGGIGARDFNMIDGSITLAAGELVDGQDLDRMVADNEANTYTGGGLQDFGAMGVKLPISDTALAAQGRVRVASTGTGAHYYDTATRQLSITGSDIANSQAGTCMFSAAVSCTVTLPVVEADALYLVQATCNASWIEWTSGKTTTQFVINASTSNSDTCDWRLIR